MTDKPVDLDSHRGMAAQHATELRRLADTVEAERAQLRRRQRELEDRFLATPAVDWPHAADKARYLLGLYADLAGPRDSHVRALIDALLEDFDRLSGAAGAAPKA